MYYIYNLLTIKFKALNNTQYKHVFRFYLVLFLTSNGYSADNYASFKFIHKNKDLNRDKV